LKKYGLESHDTGLVLLKSLILPQQVQKKDVSNKIDGIMSIAHTGFGYI
jgi:hypothetical protein